MHEDIQVRVRKAARALAGAGLVHAYGHCSQRIDDKCFLVCAPKPMGLIAPGEAGDVAPTYGALLDGVLGEVRIHQQIYRRRVDVGSVTRTMSLSTLSLTPSRMRTSTSTSCRMITVAQMRSQSSGLMRTSA